MTLIRKKWR